MTLDNITNEFIMMFPFVEKFIEDVSRVDEYSARYKLTDGRIVYYDAFNSCADFRQRKNIPDDLRNMTDEEWNKEFSDKLYRRMELAGINQRYLSELTGISTITINKYVNGRSAPTARNLSLISEALCCSADDLIKF